MDAYSWFRRSFPRLQKTNLPSSTSNINDNSPSRSKDEEELYGVTEQLVEFVKSFNLGTFKNFSFTEEVGAKGEDVEVSGNVSKDLSDWQEKHAVLVLSKSKELSQLRFQLCPRYLKEKEFWRIYFTLAKSYVTGYELHAIQLERLRQMRAEKEILSNSSVCEVEMSEAKNMHREPATLSEHDFDDL